MPGDRVRDEAERLVAAALTAISASLRAGPAVGSGFATGSAECCVCPVCRAISALRDPSSDLAERLSAGVGDLATGVAALLRTLSARGERTGFSTPSPESASAPESASPSPESASPGPESGTTAPGGPDRAERDRADRDRATDAQWWAELRRKAADAAQSYARPRAADASSGDDPWRVATRAPAPTVPAQATATEAEAAEVTDAGATGAEVTDAGATGDAAVGRPVAKKAVAKKAVARKTVAKKAVADEAEPSRVEPAMAAASEAVATRAVAKKAVAKKAVAKKAVAKKAVAKKAAASGGAA